MIMLFDEPPENIVHGRHFPDDNKYHGNDHGELDDPAQGPGKDPQEQDGRQDHDEF